jgi:hypothetical protein
VWKHPKDESSQKLNRNFVGRVFHMVYVSVYTTTTYLSPLSKSSLPIFELSNFQLSATFCVLARKLSL